jgi:hypothetical protein
MLFIVTTINLASLAENSTACMEDGLYVTQLAVAEAKRLREVSSFLANKAQKQQKILCKIIGMLTGPPTTFMRSDSNPRAVFRQGSCVSGRASKVLRNSVVVHPFVCEHSQRRLQSPTHERQQAR